MVEARDTKKMSRVIRTAPGDERMAADCGAKHSTPRHSGFALTRARNDEIGSGRLAMTIPIQISNNALPPATALRPRRVFRARFASDVALSEIRGRRESRVRAAPAVSCAKCANKDAHEHTGSAEAIRPSLRNGFTAYSALSPVTGLSCHRRLRKLPSANLTPASGRQDHTASPSARLVLSSAAPPASTASRLHVRDDCETPLR
jgi:hypothetical protein